MSQPGPSDKEIRIQYKLSGTGASFYIRDFKEYVVPPITPIIIVNGQATGTSASFSYTLPAQQNFLRIKKLLVDLVPPPGYSPTEPNTYGVVSVSVNLGLGPITIYNRYVNPSTAFNDQVSLDGEDAIFQIQPNATAVITVSISNVATYTATNVELITESSPLAG